MFTLERHDNCIVIYKETEDEQPTVQTTIVIDQEKKVPGPLIAHIIMELIDTKAREHWAVLLEEESKSNMIDDTDLFYFIVEKLSEVELLENIVLEPHLQSVQELNDEHSDHM